MIANPINFSDDPEVRHGINLLGMPIDALTERQAVDSIVGAAREGRGGWAITPNLDHLRRSTRDREFAACFDEADLVICDGMPLVWASRMQGTPLPERVAGSDLIWSLTAGAAKAGVPIYLLGGTQGAAEKAARVLKMHYPGLIVAGVECPPLGFERDDDYVAAMTERVRAAGPGLVFVALGSPKQEYLIQRIRGCLPNAWWIGVGISFSFVAGEVKRAPDWMRRCGLEWSHRLLQEPGRLAKRYLVDDLPFFAVLVCRTLLGGTFGRAKAPQPAAAPRTTGMRAWVVCLMMLLLAHVPLLAYASLRLWAREAYQFFPLAWGAAVVLAFSRLRQAPAGPPRMVASTLFLTLGTLILLFATASWTWSLALVALPLNVAALLLAMGGWKLVRAFVPAALLYLTTVPPPFAMDNTLLNSLRGVAVQWSGKILDALGVLHVISGNLIDIPGHRLFVAEACSGINSTISSLAFAVGCAMFLRRRALHGLLLAALAVLFAIICNVLRISAGAAVLQWWDYDLINGWKHETIGLIVFAMCVALILSADQMLMYMLRPIYTAVPARRVAAFAWPRLSWFTRGLTAASFAAAVAGMVLIAPQVTWSAPLWARGNLPESAHFGLPDQLAGWTRFNTTSDLKAETEGVKSDFWTYSKGSLRVLVALDYPFPEYHDLPYCYQVQGWTIASRGIVNDAGGPLEEAELARPAGNASLFFVLYDERGRWLVASQDQTVRTNLLRRLTSLRRPEVDPQPSYQMQLVVYRDGPLTRDDRTQIEQLFRAVRNSLAAQVTAQLPGHK